MSLPRAPFRETLIGCQRQRRATDDGGDNDEMVSAAAAAVAAGDEQAFDSDVMSATVAPSH